MSNKLPNRASDAGPDSGTPRDWYDWLDECRDLLRAAMRAEDQKRRTLVREAEEALRAARELLP
jgi:hypothetical protein